MSGKGYTITMAVLTVILLSLYILRAVLGSYYRNKLVACVQRCDLKAYEAIAGKKIVGLLVPPFNLHYMRLNLYMMLEKEQETEGEFDFLLAMSTGKTMRKEVIRKAYYYFVKRRDGARCRPLLDEFLTFASEEEAKECELLYDIYILKKSNHIKELLVGIEELPLAQQAINEYLISLQYENQSRMDLAREFEERSKLHLQEAVEASKEGQNEEGLEE